MDWDLVLQSHIILLGSAFFGIGLIWSYMSWFSDCTTSQDSGGWLSCAPTVFRSFHLTIVSCSFLFSGMPSQLQYCCNLLQPFGWHVSYIDTMWLCVFSFQSFCSVPLTQLVQKKWRKSKAIGKASPHQCHTNVISSWNFLQCALALR